MQYFSCTLMIDKIPKLMQFPLTVFQLTFFTNGVFTNAIFFFHPHDIRLFTQSKEIPHR